MALVTHFFGICAKQECDCLRVLASFDKYHLVVAHLLFVNPLGMSELDVDVPMMIMIIVLVVKFFRYCGACRFSKPEKIILLYPPDRNDPRPCEEVLSKCIDPFSRENDVCTRINDVLYL